jgi:hypothetical protein
MITLTSLEPRILQVLEDPTAKRYDSGTLEEAVRQGLDLLNQRLPNLTIIDMIVTTAGRDQPLTGLERCLYLVRLSLNPSDTAGRELEPGSEFSYQMQDGKPVLHFSGRVIPQCGDVLRATCAAGHTLSGLDGAAETTLADACASALVYAAAAQACLLRAGLLNEAYGIHPAEVSRLLEHNRALMERFESSLGQFKAIQEFGFPPGFPLDADDRGTGRV